MLKHVDHLKTYINTLKFEEPVFPHVANFSLWRSQPLSWNEHKRLCSQYIVNILLQDSLQSSSIQKFGFD